MAESQSTVPSEKDAEAYSLCDPTYVTFWKRQNYRNSKQIDSCWELGWKGGYDCKGAARGDFFLVVEELCVFTVVMVIHQ